jgi:hypothetical protein
MRDGQTDFETRSHWGLNPRLTYGHSLDASTWSRQLGQAAFTRRLWKHLDVGRHLFSDRGLGWGACLRTVFCAVVLVGWCVTMTLAQQPPRTSRSSHPPGWPLHAPGPSNQHICALQADAPEVLKIRIKSVASQRPEHAAASTRDSYLAEILSVERSSRGLKIGDVIPIANGGYSAKANVRVLKADETIDAVFLRIDGSGSTYLFAAQDGSIDRIPAAVCNDANLAATPWRKP